VVAEVTGDVLDAMACGVIPVIGQTNKYGPVKDGENGFVVTAEKARPRSGADAFTVDEGFFHPERQIDIRNVVS